MTVPEGFRGSPVVGYVRSAVRGDALLDQLAEQIRAYADERGLWLAKVIRDEGTSAVAAWRPTVDELVRDLKARRYAGLILPSIDHLGRPRSTALRVLDRLKSTSAWVAFLDDRGVPADDESRGR